MTPRRFAVALLSGWVGGGAAIFVYYISFLARLVRENGFDLGATPISLFGVTLLALLVVTVLFARTAPGSPARTGAGAD